MIYFFYNLKMFGNTFDENYNDVYFYLGGLNEILSEEYYKMLEEEEENNKYYDELLDYYDSYYDDYNDY
jgi:hypothetical protein